MNLSLQDKSRSNQMADSRFPTAVISHFYSAVYIRLVVFRVNYIAGSDSASLYPLTTNFEQTEINFW